MVKVPKLTCTVIDVETENSFIFVRVSVKSRSFQVAIKTNLQ